MAEPIKEQRSCHSQYLWIVTHVKKVDIYKKHTNTVSPIPCTSHFASHQKEQEMMRISKIEDSEWIVSAVNNFLNVFM